MGNPVHVDSFSALVSDPVRWIAAQLATYVAVLATTAAAVVIGAGVYALVVPKEMPAIPDRKPPAETIPDTPPPPRTKDALVAQVKGKEIGVPILLDGQVYGVVTAVMVDKEGRKQTVVIQPLGTTAGGKAPETLDVPYGSIVWHDKEQGKIEWQNTNEIVRGSVRDLWGALPAEKASKDSPRP